MTSLWEVLQYRKGKIIYTNAIGKDDMANNKRQLLARNINGSISKMFTSVLIFKAIEKKKLSLNQTIESYSLLLKMRVKLP
jgi:CubicO group peptidase (beta-lactamase class C family)